MQKMSSFSTASWGVFHGCFTSLIRWTEPWIAIGPAQQRKLNNLRPSPENINACVCVVLGLCSVKWLTPGWQVGHDWGGTHFPHSSLSTHMRSQCPMHSVTYFYSLYSLSPAVHQLSHTTHKICLRVKMGKHLNRRTNGSSRVPPARCHATAGQFIKWFSHFVLALIDS